MPRHGSDTPAATFLCNSAVTYRHILSSLRGVKVVGALVRPVAGDSNRRRAGESAGGMRGRGGHGCSITRESPARVVFHSGGTPRGAPPGSSSDAEHARTGPPWYPAGPTSSSGARRVSSGPGRARSVCTARSVSSPAVGPESAVHRRARGGAASASNRCRDPLGTVHRDLAAMPWPSAAPAPAAPDEYTSSPFVYKGIASTGWPQKSHRSAFSNVRGEEQTPARRRQVPHARGGRTRGGVGSTERASARRHPWPSPALLRLLRVFPLPVLRSGRWFLRPGSPGRRRRQDRTRAGRRRRQAHAGTTR